MPESIKDKLIVPVQIPAWSVIILIVSGAFAFGSIHNELRMLVKNQERVDLMYERQIRNVEAVAQHKEILLQHAAQIDSHTARLFVLERILDKTK